MFLIRFENLIGSFNDKDNLSNLGHLRHWLLWQLRTWIYDNLCFWQWRMTRDSILNSWDVYWLTMPSLVLFDCTWLWPMFLYITIWFEYFCMEPEKVILQFPLLDNFKYSYLHIHCATPSYFLHILSTSHGWFSNPTDLKSIMWVIGSDDNSDWTNFWEVNGV